MKEERKGNREKSTATNERFCVIGGVCPPETLCVLASSPPAPAFVSRQPRKAATTLGASEADNVVETTASQCEQRRKAVQSSLEKNRKFATNSAEKPKAV